MDILWPGFFSLLVLAPVLVALYLWILRRRKRFSVRYSSLALVHVAAAKQSRWRRHVPFALFLLAVISLVFALTRPVAIVTIPVAKRMVVLAIDVSRSMCSTDILPNRLESAKAAALEFIQSQDGNTQIGIVAFAGFAAIIQQPTADLEVLEDAIESLATARRTAIGSGLLKSIDAIAAVDKSIAPSELAPAGQSDLAPAPQGAYAPAMIVLLTDGVSNVGPSPQDAAQQAIERGLRVYTIGFGTTENEAPPDCNPLTQNDETYNSEGSYRGGNFGRGGGFRRGIDEATLQEVASLTGGEYFPAQSASELQDVFRNLPTDLITKTETNEITVFFAGLGALLITLAAAFSLLWNPGS